MADISSGSVVERKRHSAIVNFLRRLVKEKPLGTVCFAWAIQDGETSTERCRFDGDREEVRAQAVLHALQGLIERLS